MYDFEQLDPYTLIGASRNASPDELKRAYRQEIAKYHPDKWSNADSSVQEYARKRASAITQAYSQLQKNKPKSAASAAMPQESPNQTVRLVQLYDHARSLIDEGKAKQAIPVLRQIQQLDPFYRDSADLLHRAEQTVQPVAATPSKRRNNKGVFALLAGLGALLLVGAIWLLGGSKSTTADNSTATSAIVAVQPSATQAEQLPTATPESLEGSPIVPTTEPTSEPTSEPTAEPTITAIPATDTPIPATDTAIPPTQAPIPDDLTGPVLIADDLDGGGWPLSSGGNWTFDFVNGRYHMTMQPGVGTVWVFGAALPSNSVVLAADVEAVQGSAGLLIGFIDGNNYHRFLLGADGTWAFQQRSGGVLTLLASGEGLGPGRLIVAQRGALTHLYWNNTYLAEVVLPAFPNGSYGFVLAGSGVAEGYFDNLRIRQLP